MPALTGAGVYERNKGTRVPKVFAQTNQIVEMTAILAAVADNIAGNDIEIESDSNTPEIH